MKVLSHIKLHLFFHFRLEQLKLHRKEEEEDIICSDVSSIYLLDCEHTGQTLLCFSTQTL